MSTLGFCNLDEAFNTNTKLKKKGRKYTKVDNKIDDNMMEKILGRGRELYDPGSDPGEPRPKMSTDMDYVNSIADTYDNNSLFIKKRQEELLAKDNEPKDNEPKDNEPKDNEPNIIQQKENNESREIMESLRMEILNLKDEINKLKSEPNESSLNKPLREGYTNYNIDNNLIKNGIKNGITFDNDQFNELLLYVFTGIFLLIIIDYIFILGKKAF